ncbi:MAG: hypothetical protein AB7F99_05490 [Vicinamibacterales bacterium]
MKTTGRGNEGLMIVLPTIVLIVVASLAAGGPMRLLSIIEGTLRATGQFMFDLYQAIF